VQKKKMDAVEAESLVPETVVQPGGGGCCFSPTAEEGVPPEPQPLTAEEKLKAREEKLEAERAEAERATKKLLESKARAEGRAADLDERVAALEESNAGHVQIEEQQAAALDQRFGRRIERHESCRRLFDPPG